MNIATHLITHPFDGIIGGDGPADGVGTQMEQQVVAQLRERLRQVARAAQRSEEFRSQQMRVHQAELKRSIDAEREKGSEVERLRWELDQLGEREASRHKVSALQDEVRNFKTASQHKLQALEMQQLRERDGQLTRKLREAEDEVKALRGGSEKRLGEVEAQRSREMEVHERRIVKLMSVIEALTSAGDERTDMRMLAEKMNQLREVRELLEEEKGQVRAFQKRQREIHAHDAEGEREAHRRRVNELEAEAKMLRSLTQAQVDEVSQAHASELKAVQRRVTELEEEKKALKRSYEQRLADEKGQRYGDVQERERRRLALEESYKSQVAEASRMAGEAQHALTQAQGNSAELMRQVQQQQREILNLSAQLGQPVGSALKHAQSQPYSFGPLPQNLGEATAMMERERTEHQRRVLELEAEVTDQKTLVQQKAAELVKAGAEHEATVQKMRADAAKERSIAQEAADVERQATQAAMSGQMSAAMSQAEERHVKEVERMRREVHRLEDEKGRLSYELEQALKQLGQTQSGLNAERKRCMEIEAADLEEREALETQISTEAAARAEYEAARALRQKETRERVAMKFFRGAQERVGRLVFASWARYTKSRRLGAARERAAQLLATADEVRRNAEAREADIDRTISESITAMREEALRRQLEIEDQRREVLDLQRQVDKEHRIAEEAKECQKYLEERAGAVQRRAALRLFAMHGRNALKTTFFAWHSLLVAKATNHRADKLADSLESCELQLAETELKGLGQQERMSKRILKQILTSYVGTIFTAWQRWTTLQREVAELNNERRNAEADQDALLQELAASQESTEEKEGRKKEAMARRLLHGNEQRRTLVVLSAWRAWSQSEARARMERGIQDRILAAEERAEVLRLEAELIANEQKDRIAKRVAKMLGIGLVRRCFHAWADEMHNADLNVNERRLNEAIARAERAEAAMEQLHEEVLMLRTEANNSTEAIKANLATKLGKQRGQNRLLMLILHAWRQECNAAAYEDVAAKVEKEKERKAILHASRNLLGWRDRCFAAWRGDWSSAKLERLDDKSSIQMANVLERMNRDRLMHLVAQIVSAWRHSIHGDRQAKLAGNAAQAQQDKDSLAAQLRLASAAREAEARRADMVKSEARLEGQARVAQLETALRRSEVESADAVRQAELRAEERRMTDARNHQLQLDQLQSQLRLERLDREQQAEKMREELKQAHEAETKELHLLRKQVASGGFGAPAGAPSTALARGGDAKEIADLQMQLADLQAELRHRDGGGRSSTGGGGRAAAPSGAQGGGFFDWFGGGGSSSPDLLSRRTNRSSTGGYGEELEEKAAENAALAVQLDNLKMALAARDKELNQLRR